MKSLILILNPNAGENRLKPPRLEIIKRILGKKSRIYLTQNLKDLHSLFNNELKDPKQFKEEGMDLCFMGGDGSIARGLTAAYQSWGEQAVFPNLLAVRNGTINMLCNELSITKTHEQTLIDYMNGKFADTLKIASVKVSVEDETPSLGFVLAGGVGFHILEDYYQSSEFPGFVHGVWVAAKSFARALLPGARNSQLFKGANLEISVDGIAFENNEVRSVVAGTLSKVSLGLRPLPLKKPLSEKCFAVSINSLPVWKTALHAPELLFGVGNFSKFNVTGRTFSSSHVSKLEFQLSDGFTMDGEMFRLSGKSKIQITPGPVFSFYKNTV